MKSPVLEVEGKPISLGKRIGKGGEGEVYALKDRPHNALKYYTVEDPSKLEPKITAMVRSGIAKKSDFVAFPLAIARAQDGRFAGFLMKLVTGHHPLHEIYSPAARKRQFPRADFRFLVRTAANVARAVGSVHALNCVIGDINHSGILISDNATAVLIDADSFQLVDGQVQHLCRVGVPEYTPPELQSRKLSNVVRTANHDGFGLAVVIFQLLFMGRHPFVGIYPRGEMPLERAIAEYRFAYSCKRDVGMTSPPGAAKLSDFPGSIAEAFEAAFGPDRLRPSAETWVDLLVDLERSLLLCSANQLHYYPSTAVQCPWCRMEQQHGLLLFLPYFGSIDAGASASDPGAAGFNLLAVWAAIEAVQIPASGAFQPSLPTVSSAVSTELKKQIQGRRWTGGIALLFAIAVLFTAPGLWLLWGITGWFALSKLMGNGECGSEVLRRYEIWQQRWSRATDEWRIRCNIQELETLRRSLFEAKAEYELISSELERRLASYEQNRRAIQLEKYLESFQIHDATINQIGEVRKATLASFGIETAADVISSRIQAVPGFGPKNSQPLLDWRDRLEKGFVYNSKPNAIDQQETRNIRGEVEAKASALRRKLLAGANDLKIAAQTAVVRAKAVDPVLSRLHIERAQLEADLEYLSIALPSPPQQVSQRILSQPQTSGHSALTGVPSCPKCGSRMVRRTARRGSNAGSSFYGCSKYPNCRGTRPI